VIFWRKLPLRLSSDSQSFVELPIPIAIPIPIPSKFSEKRMTHSPIPIVSGLRGMTTAVEDKSSSESPHAAGPATYWKQEAIEGRE